MLLLPLLAGLARAAPAEVYVGVTPSVLFEPYDDVDALELGILPLDVAWRIAPAWTLEARPIVNLRLLPDHPLAISHLGLSLAVQRWLALGDGWSLLGGPFTTATRQRLFEETTLTLGLEGGAEARWGRLALAVSLQPGVNVYLDTPVPDRALLGHLGVIVRLGWWLGGPAA